MADFIEFRFREDKIKDIIRRVTKKTKSTTETITAEFAKILFERIVSGTPVDKGILKSRWSLVRTGDTSWRCINNTKYLKILEFGFYNNVGPKTIKISASLRLNFGIRIIGGIFSKQAPHGWIRKALSQTGNDFKSKLARKIKS